VSIKYYYPDNQPTVFLESREDLGEILDILHTQAIDNLGEDSEEAQFLVSWMEELDGDVYNWKHWYEIVKKQRDSARKELKIFKIISVVITAIFIIGLLWK
jgi:hypothetical protein